MTALVVFVLLTALLHVGRPLTCHKCNGCETASWKKETCRDVDPLTENVACLTQRIRLAGSADAMTIKKCAVYEKQKPHKCQDLPNAVTVSCALCEGDLCNDASATSSKVAYVIGFLLVLLCF